MLLDKSGGPHIKRDKNGRRTLFQYLKEGGIYRDFAAADRVLREILRQIWFRSLYASA